MKKHITSLIALALLFANITVSQSAGAQTHSAQITRVLDGDTVDAIIEGETKRLRLCGIDAPEKSQEYGTQSTRMITRMILTLNNKVTAHIVDRGRYGREIATLYALHNGKTVNINIAMVEQGGAWLSKKYFRGCQWGEQATHNAINFDKHAKQSRQGLWGGQNPTPPWVFRKQQ